MCLNTFIEGQALWHLWCYYLINTKSKKGHQLRQPFDLSFCKRSLLSPQGAPVKFLVHTAKHHAQYLGVEQDQID